VLQRAAIAEHITAEVPQVTEGEEFLLLPDVDGSGLRGLGQRSFPSAAVQAMNPPGIHRGPQTVRLSSLEPTQMKAPGQHHRCGCKAMSAQVRGLPDSIRVPDRECLEDRNALTGAACIAVTVTADQDEGLNLLVWRLRPGSSKVDRSKLVQAGESVHMAPAHGYTTADHMKLNLGPVHPQPAYEL
jgi:hypothetical protein